MPRYRALAPIFIASVFHGRGEEFESDLVPGRNWEPLDDAARAAVAARTIVPLPRAVGSHDTPLVEIPADWQSMKPLLVINLARKLGMGRGDFADAKRHIERELIARQNSAAA